MGSAYRVLVGKPEGKKNIRKPREKHLENLEVDERMLKWNFKK
jgi:hypothetical protein